MRSSSDCARGEKAGSGAGGREGCVDLRDERGSSAAMRVLVAARDVGVRGRSMSGLAEVG